MLLFTMLLLLMGYTIHPMHQSVNPWTSLDFYDLLEKDHLNLVQKDDDIKLQRYLDKKPLYISLSRRECIGAAFWLATFAPPIIASHATIQTQLASLPVGSYLVGAGIAGAWIGHEIKKLTKVLKYPMLNGVDIEQEIFENYM